MVDAYQVVRDFEKELASYAGSEYAVTTDSCTSAIFLSLLHWDVRGREVCVPCRTYPSVPCAVIHAGGKVIWTEYSWSGVYKLGNTNVFDGAKRFHREMYLKGGLHCLSFHAKKLLPIGRGGAILTDDHRAVEAFKRMRFDGRDECPLYMQEKFTLGWNCYMTPEQAARGLQLLSMAKDSYHDQIEDPPYPDLSLQECYR